MAHIYVTTNGTKIGVEGGRLVIQHKDELIRSVPKETVESITVFGNALLTTNCLQFCLMNGISVSFFSSKGKYFGRLESTSHKKSDVTEAQIDMFRDEKYSLDMCRKIVSAKIRNQEVILRRYTKSMNPKLERNIALMKSYRDSIEKSENVEQIMGYEGISARTYFNYLSMIIEPEFAFKGRNRRPPKDPFNSLLSLGYTLLMYELYPKLESEGLLPYYSVLHKTYSNHPALVTDMMEEWRSVIVDATVMSMIQGHEIHAEHFYHDEESNAVFLTREGMTKFLKKFEKTMTRKTRYLVYDNTERTMRNALHEQCRRLRLSVMNGKSEEYTPVIIR